MSDLKDQIKKSTEEMYGGDMHGKNQGWEQDVLQRSEDILKSLEKSAPSKPCDLCRSEMHVESYNLNLIGCESSNLFRLCGECRAFFVTNSLKIILNSFYDANNKDEEVEECKPEPKK